MSRVRLDDAVLDDQDALAAAREAFVVSDEDHRELAVALLLEEELQDGLAGGAVEITRRFVREEDLGVVEEGAGHGDPLALSAGELAGVE